MTSFCGHPFCSRGFHVPAFFGSYFPRFSHKRTSERCSRSRITGAGGPRRNKKTKVSRSFCYFIRSKIYPGNSTPKRRRTENRNFSNRSRLRGISRVIDSKFHLVRSKYRVSARNLLSSNFDPRFREIFKRFEN